MGEYRRENTKHLFAYLMGEGTSQLDILDRPSLGCELTHETIPTSIGGPQPQLHSEVVDINMYGRTYVVGQM